MKKQPKPVRRRLDNAIFVNVGMSRAFIKAVAAAQEYCEFLDSTSERALWKRTVHNKLDRLYKRMRRLNEIALRKAKG